MGKRNDTQRDVDGGADVHAVRGSKGRLLLGHYPCGDSLFAERGAAGWQLVRVDDDIDEGCDGVDVLDAVPREQYFPVRDDQLEALIRFHRKAMRRRAAWNRP